MTRPPRPPALLLALLRRAPLLALLRPALLLALLGPSLAACDGSAKPADDTAPADDTDTGTVETCDGPVDTLADAPTVFTGIANRATGASPTAGDFDGDGREDAAVSAYAGGPTCVFPGPVACGTLALESGTCHTPISNFDFAGGALAAGDLDGDGRDELILGAIGYQADLTAQGGVFIADGQGGSLSAATLLTGVQAVEYAGTSVAVVGDTDGDGSNDLLVGAPGNNQGGPGAGAAYLLTGPISPGPLSAAHATLLGAGTTAAQGAPAPPHATPGGGDGVGYSLSSAGDLNADGLADILLGAAGSDGTDADTGKACVFLGPLAPGTQALTDADTCFLGAAASSFAGDRVAAAGDTDGDGTTDLLISADGEEDQKGVLYLWRGAASGNLSLSYAPVAWVGEAAEDQAGYAIAAGDDDGDGLTDIVVGAWGRDGAALDAGRTYLLVAPFTDGRHSLAEAIHWDGERENDYSSRALAPMDMDGDGAVEWLIGAPFASVEGPAAGRAYIVY